MQEIKYISIRIKKEYVMGEIRNFTFYLDLSELVSKFFWKGVNCKGTNIRAISLHGKRVPREICDFDKRNKKGSALFKVDVSPKEDTVFFIYLKEDINIIKKQLNIL